MIYGGSTDGYSNRARKAWSRRELLGISSMGGEEKPTNSFGPQDLQGVSLHHNDALVIQAKITNYDIRRVFVDSGSSVNVIFQGALDQMDLKDYKLEPVETTMFGFAGHSIHPGGARGEIVLPLTVGYGDLRKSVMTTFSMVDAASSYKFILGRPAMNTFKAVASTYHHKIKLSVRVRIGEVQGDQPSSRKCYVETIRIEKRWQEWMDI
ncbi:uncharacterized protein [Primulina huaijiensis]|uniref:uncharacterized protein n=1 Tax=Primulina huaijiensis TaxID=1492673 RepID=UPI003CC6EC00